MTQPTPLLVAIVHAVTNIILQLVALCVPACYLAASSFPSIFMWTWLTTRYSTAHAAAATPAISMVYLLTSGALLVLLKWVLVGRLRPGSHRVWSSLFARRWIVRQAMRACWTYTPWVYMGETAALTWLYRGLGCRIGPGATLGLNRVEDPDLVVIGAGSSIQGDLSAVSVRLGMQTLTETRVGARCVVASNAFVSPGAALGDGVQLQVRCMVPEGSQLADDTHWEGKPAKRTATAEACGEAATADSATTANETATADKASTGAKSCNGAECTADSRDMNIFRKPKIERARSRSKSFHGPEAS